MSGPELEYAFASKAGEVRYGTVGTGPDVVLVHGTPWSSFTWHLLIDVLAKSHRVHYYDLPGYGLSEMRRGQQVSLDVQGEVLAQFLEHTHLDQPAVIAHDFGGAISLRAHLLHGCNYARLMLIDVVALAPWGSPFFAHVQQHEAAFAGVPAYIHQAIVERYIQGALYRTLDDATFRRLVDPWLSEKGQAAFYRQIAQADQRYTDDIEPLYANVRCPVSILWGQEDAWIPLATGRRLHAAVPGSTFVELANAGHLAQLDAPARVARQVLKFLSA